MSVYIEELAKLANMFGDFTVEGWYKEPPKPAYRLATVVRSKDGYAFYVDGIQVPYQKYASVLDCIAFAAFSHVAAVPPPKPSKIDIMELRLTKAIREIYQEEKQCTESSSLLKAETDPEKQQPVHLLQRY